MANSLTTSIMKNISKKSISNNLDKKHNKVVEGKEVNNLRDNEEEILLSILHKNKNRAYLSYTNKEVEKSINDKKSINDLINKTTHNNVSNKIIDEKKEPSSIKIDKANIKIQSLKNLANNNLKVEKEEYKNKQVKKITSLRDLAK